MGGYLSKSHSGKWNLECLLVLENSFFLTCVFSVAASLLQKGLSSCLRYPPVFSELGIFLRQLIISPLCSNLHLAEDWMKRGFLVEDTNPSLCVLQSGLVCWLRKLASALLSFFLICGHSSKFLCFCDSGQVNWLFLIPFFTSVLPFLGFIFV